VYISAMIFLSTSRYGFAKIDTGIYVTDTDISLKSRGENGRRAEEAR